MHALKLLVSFLVCLGIWMGAAHLSFGQMLCLHSGESEMQWGKAEACGMEEGESSVDETCCVISNFSAQLDQLVAVKWFKVEKSVIDLPYMFRVFSTEMGSDNPPGKTLYSYSEKEDPPPIRHSESFLSVFLI